MTPEGSADDGKRNEMEMDVAFRAGGQSLGESLREAVTLDSVLAKGRRISLLSLH